MNWLRRLRGAFGMGVTWAIGWAIAGILTGVASLLTPGLPWDSFFQVFDAPLPALAVPGFFGGVIFSIVLGIAARRRKFDELSLPRFAAWGAVGGLLLSLLPNAMVAVGLASLGNPDAPLWRSTLVIMGPFTALGAISATVSLLMARRASQREALPAGGEPGDTLRARGTERQLNRSEPGHFVSLHGAPGAEGSPARGRGNHGDIRN